MEWQEAQDNCQDKFDSASGRLFEPRSTTMNLAVWKAADELGGAQGDGSFWLGITDLKEQGTYRYDSNDEEVVDCMWYSTQPNNDNENCVYPRGSFALQLIVLPHLIILTIQHYSTEQHGETDGCVSSKTAK